MECAGVAVTVDNLSEVGSAMLLLPSLGVAKDSMFFQANFHLRRYSVEMSLSSNLDGQGEFFDIFMNLTYPWVSQ